MYLSRVEIPWGSAANPYNLHKAIWDLFPGQEKEQRKSVEEDRTGFLFRVESNKAGQSARLLVQSLQEPKSLSGRAFITATKAFEPDPKEGQLLAFVLTANPVKTIADTQGRLNNKRDRPKRCRVPLISEKEQAEWLARKLSVVAEIKSVQIHKESPKFFYKNKSGDKQNGKHQLITFEGVLEVKDSEGLKRMLRNGIGPAKAFGCGLMLVRRI